MNKRTRNWFFRLTACGVVAAFTLTTAVPAGYAQSAAAGSFLNLPAPGAMVGPSAPFAPPIIRGLKIDPANPLRFDFIIDTGDNNLDGEEFEAEATKLIKYFLAALTVPEDDFWVNLSPYEKDRIIPEGLGATELGRDLLAEDYLLKQITASLMYPEERVGSEFWKRVYDKARQLYGTSEIPINTFNKVWIVPDRAVVYEYDGGAFVGERHLKVMLEEDYLALKSNRENKEIGTDQMSQDKVEAVNSVASGVVREVLIPELEKEVNEGSHFATLRQIFNSMILATWYKKNLRETLLGQVYIDQNKVKGVDVEDKTVPQKIYDRYLDAFKKGVYDYIKEDYDSATHEVIARRYFSGGITAGEIEVDLDVQRLPEQSPDAAKEIVGAESGGNLREVATGFTSLPNTSEESPDASSGGVKVDHSLTRKNGKQKIMDGKVVDFSKGQRPKQLILPDGETIARETEAEQRYQHMNARVQGIFDLIENLKNGIEKNGDIPQELRNFGDFLTGQYRGDNGLNDDQLVALLKKLLNSRIRIVKGEYFVDELDEGKIVLLAHAGRGLQEEFGGPRVWMGEEAFNTLSDIEIVGLMIEEGLHILNPDGKHNIDIHHNTDFLKDILKKLLRAKQNEQAEQRDTIPVGKPVRLPASPLRFRGGHSPGDAPQGSESFNIPTTDETTRSQFPSSSDPEPADRDRRENIRRARSLFSNFTSVPSEEEFRKYARAMKKVLENVHNRFITALKISDDPLTHLTGSEGKIVALIGGDVIQAEINKFLANATSIFSNPEDAPRILKTMVTALFTAPETWKTGVFQSSSEVIPNSEKIEKAIEEINEAVQRISPVLNAVNEILKIALLEQNALASVQSGNLRAARTTLKKLSALSEKQEEGPEREAVREAVDKVEQAIRNAERETLYKKARALLAILPDTTESIEKPELLRKYLSFVKQVLKEVERHYSYIIQFETPDENQFMEDPVGWVVEKLLNSKKSSSGKPGEGLRAEVVRKMIENGLNVDLSASDLVTTPEVMISFISDEVAEGLEKLEAINNVLNEFLEAELLPGLLQKAQTAVDEKNLSKAEKYLNVITAFTSPGDPRVEKLSFAIDVARHPEDYGVARELLHILSAQPGEEKGEIFDQYMEALKEVFKSVAWRLERALEIGGIAPQISQDPIRWEVDILIYQGKKFSHLVPTILSRMAKQLVKGGVLSESLPPNLIGVAILQAESNAEEVARVQEAGRRILQNQNSSISSEGQEGSPGAAEESPDAAMVVGRVQPGAERIQTKTENPGGINLNPAMFDLEIKRDSNGIPLPVSQQPIQNIKIDGFFPVIISVTPITVQSLLSEIYY